MRENHLNKEGAIEKLKDYGVSNWQGVSRLIREQGLPVKYITPRKPFFVVEDLDKWIDRREKEAVFANALHTKILTKQRKARREAKKKDYSGIAAPVDVKTFKKGDAV
jgi:hypothetical protein